MDKTLLQENKTKLLAEQKRIQVMLRQYDVVDSEIPGGHKPKYDEIGSEDGENAHESEQFGNDLAVTEDLEKKLEQIQDALKRIADGTYGKCLIGGEEIDEARLRVEPAAETCVAHSK